MLHITMITASETIPLPSLSPDDPAASLTDHQASGPVHLILACHADVHGATVGCIFQGMTQEEGLTRVIVGSAQRMIVEHWIPPGETYERPLQTTQGPAILRLTHEATP